MLPNTRADQSSMNRSNVTVKLDLATMAASVSLTWLPTALVTSWALIVLGAAATLAGRFFLPHSPLDKAVERNDLWGSIRSRDVNELAVISGVSGFLAGLILLCTTLCRKNAAQIHEHQSPPAPHVIHYQTRVADAKLEQILDTYPVGVIAGIAGAGKTELALHYAKGFFAKHQALKPWIWIIDASDNTSLTKGYEAMARDMAITNTHARITPAMIMRQLATTTRPYLLIFDNVPQRKNIDASIESSLSLQSTAGKVLIVTQDARFCSPPHNLLRLDGFTPQEAVDYLHGSGACSKKEAQRLARSLDYLPLALEQARNALLSRIGPADQYRKELTKWREGDPLVGQGLTAAQSSALQ